MRTKSFLSVAGALALSLGALALSLGIPTVARAGGDAAAGKVRSEMCSACHVTDAATADIPHLAGQRATYIAKQLKAFKAGDRKHPVMNAVTSILNEADIDNISAFWASQPAGSDNKAPPPEIAAIRKTKMTFPKDFPKGFTLYGTVNKEGQGVVAKQYINAAGLAAAKAGKPIGDGAVIIVVNHTAKLDADKKPIADKDGSWVTDKVKNYEGMEARAGWGKDIPDPLRNNTWSYAIFTPDKAVNNDVNQAICLACHIPAASNNYVFGVKKMQTAAHAK